MLGVTTMTWAWAENALGIAIGIIDESVPSMRGHDGLPISLKKRLSYVKTALKDVTALKPLQEEGYALVKLFMDLKGRRHDLVHGSAWLMEHGGLKLQRFTIKGRQHTSDEKPVEIADLVRLNREIEVLDSAAMGFLIAVASIFGKQSHD